MWRGLSTAALADYLALADTSFFPAALERGDVVGTQLADEPADLPGAWAGVLRHDRVTVLTYPYEWSFEMLRNAARLQLALTRQALAEGLIIKDASSYNMQFVGTKPVFIDVGSFERVQKGQPWAGYRQFCELYLNPLYVQALRDVAFQPLLRGSVDGISPKTTASLLGRTGRFQKGVFTHVRLHARAERRYADADRERDVRAELERAGFGRKLIDAQLRNLERAVEALSWRQQASTWSDYGSRSHYTERDLAAKDSAVADAVGATANPGIVLDLGANDGRFSRVALASGARSVIAVDSDDVVVDRLYRDLRSEGERRILPLVLDLADPSPAIGWRSQERPSFVERVRPDLTLCLAVVHHLALTNNVPLDEIVAFLADFGAPVLVEFPHRDDEMAIRLLARKRSGLFASYDIPNWERALEHRFVIRRRTVLPNGTRTLYRCEPAT
ncbi:nodulation protein NoeA [soil metagenome]